VFGFSVTDIVFLIFLYQRWIYKVDPTRVNEFGTSGESGDAVAEQPTAALEAAGEPKPATEKKDD